jgi:DNA-binding NarL/FixJ family response regulator
MSQNSPEQRMLKILVVDDQELILSGTLDLLKRHYLQAKILTAKTTQNPIEQIETFGPDLVIMDLCPQAAVEVAQRFGQKLKYRNLTNIQAVELKATPTESESLYTQ